MFSAVACYGISLLYASVELRDSNRIVERAIRTDVLAAQFSSARLMSDYTFVIQCIQKHSSQLLPYVSEKLKDSPTVVLSSISLNYKLTQFASKNLRSSEWFIEQAMALFPQCFF